MTLRAADRNWSAPRLLGAPGSMLALLIVLFLFVVVVISGLRKESYSVLDRLDPQLWRHLHH